jgi:hypothetical protein
VPADFCEIDEGVSDCGVLSRLRVSGAATSPPGPTPPVLLSPWDEPEGSAGGCSFDDFADLPTILELV